jgi:thiamine pyrophosphate-dependent acetolactate synthase large subunit-like protein
MAAGYAQATRNAGVVNLRSVVGVGHAMGTIFGLPAALGVALGRRNEKIIALLGDGASMYAIQGLWTAAQLNRPITFIIVNNRLRSSAATRATLRSGAHRGNESSRQRFSRARGEPGMQGDAS